MDFGVMVCMCGKLVCLIGECVCLFELLCEVCSIDCVMELFVLCLCKVIFECVVIFVIVLYEDVVLL